MVLAIFVANKNYKKITKQHFILYFLVVLLFFIILFPLLKSVNIYELIIEKPLFYFLFSILILTISKRAVKNTIFPSDYVKKIFFLFYFFYLIAIVSSLFSIFFEYYPASKMKIFFYDYAAAFFLFRFYFCNKIEKIFSITAIYLVSFILSAKFILFLFPLLTLFFLLYKYPKQTTILILPLIILMSFIFSEVLKDFFHQTFFYINHAIYNANNDFRYLNFTGQFINPNQGFSTNYISLSDNYVSLFNRFSTLTFAINNFYENIFFGYGFDQTISFRFNKTQVNGLLFIWLSSFGVFTFLLIAMKTYKIGIVINNNFNLYILFFFLIISFYQLLLANRFLSSMLLFKLYLIFYMSYINREN